MRCPLARRLAKAKAKAMLNELSAAAELDEQDVQGPFTTAELDWMFGAI